MRIITSLFFLILFNNCFSQKNSDYEIYSTIIDDYHNRIEIKKKFTKNAVIIDKLDTKTNWAEEGYEFVDYAFFEYRIDSIKRQQLKKMLSVLKESYFDSPVLIVDNFECKVNLFEISRGVLNDLFADGTNKGWENFYKTYPKSLGAFSFSNIIYSNDLAILFVDFRRNSLFASGDFYIMKKKGNKWIIDNVFNMYKA